ncbi:MAG: twin-arginine translocation signal domain-containing protein [Planctomycetaceae bacterium]|nr:twin-arginine translocation signal domain-containing protein [Planctomycetaceae bacterium]
MDKLTRRHFLKFGGAVTAATMIPHTEMPLFASESSDTVRDRLWIWGHLEGSYDNQYGLPMNSRMTPLQGAESLGIPNIIMVRYSNKPEPPYDEYAAQYRNVQKLMWSFVGDSGRTSSEEQEHVLELSQKMPNMTGLFMDDFFHGNANAPAGESEAAASISVVRLKEIRERLNQLDQKPDLGVVLYAHQLNPAIRRHLDLCDLVSFWSWTAGDLAKLPENFAKYQGIAPNKRTLLGIYMWDFGLGKPLPMDLMRMQCETALKWLKEGTIEGMIFLATNICDMKIEAVEYARQWITEHGAETV